MSVRPFFEWTHWLSWEIYCFLAGHDTLNLSKGFVNGSRVSHPPVRTISRSIAAPNCEQWISQILGSEAELSIESSLHVRAEFRIYLSFDRQTEVP
jgi:hypothetical protein